MVMSHPRNTRLKKTLMLSSLLLLLSLFAQTGIAREQHRLLLSQFKEPDKSLFRQVLQLVDQQRSGRVISVERPAIDEIRHYRVKLINKNGRLETYYVNKDINQLKP